MSEKEENNLSKNPESNTTNKKREKDLFSLYKIEGNKIKRLRPTCERCGTGYFMAEHENRYTCGHCGFTRYKTPNKE